MKLRDNGNLYKVNVATETKGNIEGAAVQITVGKISVKLPNTDILTKSNQTTVTVTDKDAKPVKDMSVTVTDKNNATATKATDANGLPFPLRLRVAVVHHRAAVTAEVSQWYQLYIM